MVITLAQVNSARHPAALQLQPKALQSKSEVQAKNYVKFIYQIKISEKEKILPLNILEKKSSTKF